MAVQIKINIPIYKKNEWGSFDRKGKLQISSDVEAISEGYAALKKEIDQLISEMDGSVRLAGSLNEMKTEIITAAQTLERLKRDIDKATRHYESLKLFLNQFGVDTQASRLTFDGRLRLESSSEAAVEVLSAEEESEIVHEISQNLNEFD